MNQLRSCCLGILVGGAIAFAMSCSGTQQAPCGPSTCDGCCNISGQCVSGESASGCGTGGAACDVCAGGETCSAGVCQAPPTEEVDAGGGTDSGTPDAGGEPDSGTPDSGVPDAGPEVTPFATYAEFAAARDEALCQLAVRCGVFGSVDACRSSGWLVGYDLGLDPAAEAAALKDGRLVFHGTEARICVDELDALACTGFSTALKSDACTTALKSAVAVGGECFNDQECGALAYCTAVGTSCPGMCLAKKAEGEASTSDQECLDGLYAGRSGTCEQRVAIGDSCAGASHFLPPKECVADAWCDDNRICQPKGDLQALCQDDTNCFAPYVCRFGKCAMRGALSAACAPNSPCRLELMCDTTSWDQPGTCAVPKGAGGSCFQSEQCEDGLFCRGSPTPDHCAAPGAIGEACQPYTDGNCASDAYCDTTTNVCTARIPTGQPCTDQGTCQDDGFCDVTCKPRTCEDPTP